MKTNLKLMLPFLLCGGMIFGQAENQIQINTLGNSGILTLNELKNDPEMDKIRNEINGLKDNLTILINEKFENEKSQYSFNYTNFMTSVLVINEISNTYSALITDRKQAEAYNILASVNNSESSMLGFSFSKVVLESMNDEIKKNEQLKAKDRLTFVSGITKLVNGIADFTNPVNLIGSTIQYISGFIPSSRKNLIDEDFINKFKETTRDYQTYYADLDANNRIFNESLISLESKYSGLALDIDSYIQQNITQSNIDLHQLIPPQVNTIFNYSSSESPNFPYRTYNNKLEVKRVIKNLNDLKIIVEQLNEYYYDYTKIVNTNFDRNTQLLNNAKKLPRAKSNEIDDLQKRLKELKEGSSTTGNGSIQEIGFSQKFKKNFEQISNHLKQLNK